MGPFEWFLVTSVLSGLVAILVTYYVLDKEMARVESQILELEREVHKQNLDSIIDRIERDEPHSWDSQTSVSPRRGTR